MPPSIDPSKTHEIIHLLLHREEFSSAATPRVGHSAIEDAFMSCQFSQSPTRVDVSMSAFPCDLQSKPDSPEPESPTVGHSAISAVAMRHCAKVRVFTSCRSCR